MTRNGCRTSHTGFHESSSVTVADTILATRLLYNTVQVLFADGWRLCEESHEAGGFSRRSLRVIQGQQWRLLISMRCFSQEESNQTICLLGGSIGGLPVPMCCRQMLGGRVDELYEA